MVDFECKERYDFEDLVEVVRLLRGPGGCPWDAEQTHASIRRNFLEETCEACEAIDLDDPVLLCEELGDVLLQVLFHTSLETDAGRFTLTDVCDGEVKKLVFRHPHVFGNLRVSGSDEVLSNWEELKKAEKGQQTHTSTLQSVSRALPGLWRAEKVQKKAQKAGIPAPDASESLALLRQDYEALRQSETDDSALLGNLLFDAVALARARGIDPEVALNAATEQFIRRFAALDPQTDAVTPLAAEGKDALWSRNEAPVPKEQS